MNLDSTPVMVGQSKCNVPRAVLDPCGFKARDTVDLYAREGVLVMVKHRMTAMELVSAMDRLHQLVLGLAEYLADACGHCDDCCGEGKCPCELPADGRISIPADMLREAGIPAGVKLAEYPNEEDGTVTVAEADYAHDLTDVPVEILDLLLEAGICTGELEERLMMEDVVYGPEG